MYDICELLGIEYNESLTKSTCCNIPWAGNSSDGKDIFGFDKEKSVLKYKTELPRIEIITYRVSLWSFDRLF